MLNIAEERGWAPDTAALMLEHTQRLISQLRARQLQLLQQLDGAQVASRDGAASLQDWLAGRLDVAPESARRLVHASRLLAEHHSPAAALADGDVTLDRAVAITDLIVAGADDEEVARASGHDISGVRRLVARRRRVTRRSEQEILDGQYVVIQPSLDEAQWTLHGRLAAQEGRIVDEALNRRSEQLPAPVVPGSRSQRHAHALVSIAQDAVERDAPGTSSSTPVVTVFVDAERVAVGGIETGAEIAAGPRVGPLTLERLLCEGRVGVIAATDLGPVAASATSHTIPPAVRRWVLQRDGGCVVDGCSSRYRLQPHHIRPRSEGGGHEPHNLATLCWYHHHVAIHTHGFRLDPQSPPRRRRLIPPIRGPD